MNIEIKEAIEAIAFVSGWVAAFTSVKVKNNQALKKLEEIKQEMDREDRLLHERLSEKKRIFDDFRQSVMAEISKIKNDNHKFLETDHAERKFATKTELELMIKNVSTQYQALSDKMDSLMERLPKR
ncbi:hypothetical protein [Nitratifractor salsuginis]|uniref:Uncharacterized protein n=1 Tax=Nitratifractor salsuginis (strain DSM 16511 / JCM 12458 / E9I37-1) TaxID=749222 RepID=E6WY35_NITSE|nr:hypothetical protein [Nitratifractor salsuginis]ADV46409.1 hypothetical protein Nitsa_1156 [Nitratifractor salsuginis DSM 16511]